MQTSRQVSIYISERRRKAGWHGRVGCIRVIMAQVVACIKALARNNYKALAVLDIMQCLIGFSKRGCCHDTCDVEVVVVQIFVSWCSRSARSPLPRVLSSITFSFSIGFRSNVVLVAITSKTHSRQENKQYSKKATRPRRNPKRKWLGPLSWRPIHGPKKHEWWYAEHKL